MLLDLGRVQTYEVTFRVVFLFRHQVTCRCRTKGAKVSRRNLSQRFVQWNILAAMKRRVDAKTVRLPNGGSVLLLGGSLTKYSLFLTVFSQLGSSDKEPIKLRSYQGVAMIYFPLFSAFPLFQICFLFLSQSKQIDPSYC